MARYHPPFPMAVAGVFIVNSEKIEEKIDKLWSDLKTQRDELRVQVHLAKAELKDEWEEVEDKYQYAQSRFDELKKQTGEAADDAQVTLDVVLEEIGEAYGRVKHRLKKS
jgi:predicted nuclease with TOPRIM domain